MNWASFTAISNGTRVLNHGWDQCVALANLYHESVIGGSFVPVGSAYQWWTLYSNFATLTQNYTPSSTPVPGAIFIARYGIYNAPDGHIGVVTSVNSNGTFNTMEQNAGTWRYVGRYTRGMSNILGFLIPRNNPAGTPSSQQSTTSSQRDFLNKKKSKEQDEMVYIHLGGNFAIFRLGVKGSWFEFTGQGSANQLATQLGNAMTVASSTWNDLKDRHK